MKRILLDQNAPVGLRDILKEFEVSTAHALGWGAYSNGDLIKAAEQAGFEVLITADKNLRYQQNLASRKITIIVLGSNRWETVKASGMAIISTVTTATPGTVIEILTEEAASRVPMPDRPR
jgi:predicted nuclease of predicted toxin-antitoxin system